MFTKILNARMSKNEDGLALVLVISVGLVLSILVVTGIAYAVGGIKNSRSTQDWDAALSAAYAGVEEYQSRLAADPVYWKYGNKLAPYTVTSKSEVVDPPTPNPAFGIKTTDQWGIVAGSNSANPGRFRYEVDNSKYASSGVLRLRTTGNVGGSVRTLVSDLKQQGFLDFLYFTDYEIRDPAMANVKCKPAYDWAVLSRPNCDEIQFGKFDTLNGPVHSNDTLLICGGKFTGIVTTGNTKKPIYNTVSGCSGAEFTLAQPTYSPVVGMPATNAELKRETRNDLDNPAVGCLYTGPTSIKFSSDGYMTVRSPWTELTNIKGEPVATGGSVSSDCGTPGASGLGSSGGQKVKVPSNRVIYVQNIPAAADSASAGPNAATSAETGSGVACNDVKGNPVAGNGIGYPIAGEIAPSTGSNASYGCRSGDVFVEGTMSGQLTIGAENFVYATGDIRYNNDQKDMLGLVGNNAVYVHNPVNVLGKNVLPKSDRRIDSAILSVAHTFTVQNYAVGDNRGVLTVNGAIAQAFRGPVATASGNTIATGYAKNYLYDTRYRYAAPPKFLSPVTTTYGVTVWVETASAFNSDGSPR